MLEFLAFSKPNPHSWNHGGVASLDSTCRARGRLLMAGLVPKPSLSTTRGESYLLQLGLYRHTAFCQASSKAIDERDHGMDHFTQALQLRRSFYRAYREHINN